MKNFKLGFSWCAMAFVALSFKSYAFEIYVHLPYQAHYSSKNSDNTINDFYSKNNIKQIKLVYDDRLLDLPQNPADRKHALLAPQKVQSVATEHFQQSQSLVSLDLESWNRFDADTPTKILHTLKAYRSANPDAVLGLYATVPQNTYKWDPAKIQFYEKMNSQYTDVAQEVDYFSPSLYNYSGTDFPNWLEGAKYNIAAAKKYSTEKKVIPYITPEVSIDGNTTWLSYDEMLMRLKALDSMGADGCIIWGSSRSRDTSGARPALNPETGWLKAVLEFSSTHAQ